VDWAAVDTRVSNTLLPALPIIEAPTAGRIVSYLVEYGAGEPVRALVLAQTGAGERFVATSARHDTVTLTVMLGTDPAGRDVQVTRQDSGELHFTLA
jgi:hypothetical protein